MSITGLRKKCPRHQIRTWFPQACSFDDRAQAGVAIAAGKVTAGAKRTIDADGLVVAPASIDSHTHCDARCENPPPYATTAVTRA
jgi:adenine deaminase